jgi:hypothetical protein
MNRDERRWATSAAAVLAFCWTLVMFAPPTSQPILPSTILADGLAAFAGHLFLGVFAIAGLFVAAKVLLQRPTLETKTVSRPESVVHAA